MSRRTDKASSLIRDELAMMLLRGLNDPRLEGVLVSITRVKVADDLGFADVYVTIMGAQGKQSAALNALQHSAGMMRSKLMEAMSTRVTPYIRFHLDDDLKRELSVLDVLDQVAQENAELDRKRAEAAEAAQAPAASPSEPSTDSR